MQAVEVPAAQQIARFAAFSRQTALPHHSTQPRWVATGDTSRVGDGEWVVGHVEVTAEAHIGWCRSSRRVVAPNLAVGARDRHESALGSVTVVVLKIWMVNPAQAQVGASRFARRGSATDAKHEVWITPHRAHRAHARHAGKHARATTASRDNASLTRNVRISSGASPFPPSRQVR